MTEISPAEAADRLALRELFDAYTHCADRRDAEGQKRSSPPTPASPFTWTARAATRHRRSESLRDDDALQWAESTVTIDGDGATGESYTIAHHLFTEDGNRMIMVASLRYLDTFAKIDGSWYFAERNLVLDWSETRPSSP